MGYFEHWTRMDFLFDFSLMDLLSKLDEIQYGIGVGITNGSSSDMFFSLHCISKAVQNKKKVLFVSCRSDVLNLRMMCSKLALRYDPMLVHLHVPRVIEDAGLCSCSSLDDIVSASAQDYSLVILEDVSVFSRFGLLDHQVLDAVAEIRRNMPDPSLLYVSSPVVNKLTNMISQRADFTMSFENIGDGFSKNVTGKVQISSRSTKTVLDSKEFLYLTGERTMKCFYPGSVPLLS